MARERRLKVTKGGAESTQRLSQAIMLSPDGVSKTADLPEPSMALARGEIIPRDRPLDMARKKMQSKEAKTSLLNGTS